MLDLKKTSTLLLIIALTGATTLAQEGNDGSWKLLSKKDSTSSIRSEKQVLESRSKLQFEEKRDSTIKPGKVTIHQNERIDELIDLYTTADKKLEGFRIQVFIGKAKEAQKLRTDFVSKYPDIPAYAQWQSPNMKVRIGDLRTRLDAERVLREIRKDFPGAYIVKDFIALPDLDPPMVEKDEAEK